MRRKGSGTRFRMGVGGSRGRGGRGRSMGGAKFGEFFRFSQDVAVCSLGLDCPLVHCWCECVSVQSFSVAT